MVAIVVGVVVTVVMLILLHRIFFYDSSDFWECVKYSFKPDLFSIIQGEWGRDIAKTFKLQMYLFCCFGLGVLAYWGTKALLP